MMTSQHDFKLPEFVNRFHLENLLMFLLLLIVGFIFYGRAIGFGLTYLDDNTLMVNYRHLLSDPANIGKVFTTNIFPEGNNYYRPVLLLSLMFDYVIGYGSFQLFHFTNILLHILAAFSFFLFLKEICPRNPRTFLTFMFLNCPILVSGAVWVPARNDSLLTIFTMLSFLFTALYSTGGSKKNLIWLFISVLLAFLTKENALVLVLLIPMLPFCLNRVSKDSKRRIMLITLSVLAALFIWSLLWQNAHTETNGIQWPSLFTASLYFPHLFGKMLFPFFPSPAYEVAGMSNFYPILAAAAVLGIYMFAAERENASLVVFGLATSFLFIFPTFVTEQKIVLGQPYWLEHRFYVPIAGFFIALSQLMIPVCGMACKKLFMPLGFAVLIVYSCISFNYAETFRDKTSYWDKIAMQPEFKGNALLLAADGYLEKWQHSKNLEFAKQACQRYITSHEISPLRGENLFSLGITCVATGSTESAKEVIPLLNSQYPWLARNLSAHIQKQEAAHKQK